MVIHWELWKESNFDHTTKWCSLEMWLERGSCCEQHPTKQQLYSHLQPITKTIKIRRTRHAGYCWRTRDELISDVLLWTPSHGRAKAGRPTLSYIQQLFADRGCSPDDRPEVMIGRGSERGSGTSVLIEGHDDDDQMVYAQPRIRHRERGTKFERKA